MRQLASGVTLVVLTLWMVPQQTEAQGPLSLLSGAGALGVPLPGIGGGSSGFHLDVDVGYFMNSVKFANGSDVIPELCLSVDACGTNDYSTEVIRGTVGIGLGSIALEVFAERPLSDVPGVDWTYGIGGRLDTSPGNIVSFQVRLAYLRHTGDYEGEGGRGAVGLLVRPLSLFALYGEAALDVTTVPEAMNEAGTLFSYSYSLGGGVRFYLGL